MERLGFTYEFLWGCALGMIPLAVCAWFVCGMLRDRPAARHALWMVALVSLVSPAVLVAVGVPRLPDIEGSSGAARGEIEPAAFDEVSVAADRAAVPVSHGAEVVAEGPAWTRAPASPVLLEPWELTGIGLPSEMGEGSVASGGSIAGAIGSAGGARVEAAERRSWRGALVSARRALLSLPAIPRWLWAGGAIVFAIILLRQLNRLRRIVRGAELATWDVQHQVRRLSGRMGLKRAPEALFVGERISPMITCGFTPRVLLPRELWDELDGTSREAVLVHELAHLRRRDHVLCWVETMLGVLYWWHPVVWWVRRNLHEDADLCCDAWVTSLLPGHRRAYAEALVTTREFIGNGGDGDARPVSCTLGMTTARAKRFSRRLSMVMTRKMSPRASGAGLLLAVAALTGGAMLTPTLACPPEEEEKASLAYLRAAEPSAVVFMDATPAPAVAPGLTYSALRAPQAAGQPDRRRAASDLEARMSRLEAQMERLANLLEGRRSTGVGAGSVDIAPRFRGNPPPPPVRPDAAGGETTQRGYALPEGKLDAMWELMARPDVPVFVSRGKGNSIVVHGTAAQHRAFKAFCDIINPVTASGGGGARVDETRAAEGRAVGRRGRAAEAGAHGEADEARRLLNRAIEHENDARRRQGDGAGGGGRSGGAAAFERLEQQAERMMERAEMLEERGEEMLEEAEELAERGDKDRAERLHKQAKALLEQAEMMEAEAEALEERAEAMEAEHDDDWDDDDDECDDDDDDDGLIRQ